MQLNEAQYKAVCHGTGPMLVLAGPGSGKTRVITERIKHLTETGVRPENIMVVTFTRAAALEMRQRYLTGDSRQGVLFGTFHSIFFLILKNAYKFTSSNIISEEEQRRFIQSYIRKNGIESNDEKEQISDILSEISKVKSEMYNINDYYSLSCPAESFRDIYMLYDKWLKNGRKIDFDDMMIYTYQLFKARPDILAAWQRRFKYILVDEFQDINMLQYNIVRMLAAPLNNLFVVGDDDQAIYSFRGSKPELMLGFENDYPEAKKVVLDVNYRCSGNILKAASKVIVNNTKRFPKELKASRPSGEEVEIKEFKDIREENNYILNLIDMYIKNGFNYQDIAILYRTNMQPQPLVQKLLEYNIPVRLKDGIPDIYEHWIAKDIMAYIFIALGKRDREYFTRIINRPKRYISRDALDEKTVSFDRLLALYEDKAWMCERIYQLESDIKAIRGMSPQRGIRYIDRVVGYGDFLREYAEERDIDEGGLRDILEQIYYQAGEFSSYEDFIDGIGEYAEWSKNRENDSEAVTLMTLHGSKGLEFEKVIIMDVNEEISPHKMSVKPDEIEEERRMFYVGMTRAKTKLHLLYVKNRYSKVLQPSMFLDEITKQAVD